MATYPYTSPSISNWICPFWCLLQCPFWCYCNSFKSWYSSDRDTLCTEPNSAISWWCTQVQLHDTAVSILYAGPMSMGVFLSHPNHRSKPYLISALAGWRDRESARHTWISPVLTLSWVRRFPKLSLRKNDTTTFPAEGTSEIHPLSLYDSSWEWCQMALCVFIHCQGFSIAKEWMASCNATSETLLPPELGLQDLQESQR